MRQYNVFPECNVDTNLVGYLLGGYPKHKSCCNEVVKAVNGTDQFAIGIIDADKRPATMDKGFAEYTTEETIDGFNRHVAMFVHNDGKRYLFTVKPAMDKFIFDAAKAQGVNMAEAGFSTSFEDFKKETKRIQAATDAKLRRLFALIEGCPELQRLRNTLKYLMHKQYNANPEVAKAFFNGSLTITDLKGFLFGGNEGEVGGNSEVIIQTPTP